MTAAIALANSEMPSPAQQAPWANAFERQPPDFATLLAALVRASTMTQQDHLASPRDEPRASTPAATRGEVFHEIRAAEFLETGVFGLMGVSALIDAADTMAVRMHQIATSSGGCAQHLPQQGPARDLLTCRVALAHTPNSAMTTSSTSPQQRLPSRPPVDIVSRPPDAVAEATSVTLRTKGRCENRSLARISFRYAEQRALLLAYGQTNAVHVAITAAEHGLSVFARVGRMEPTERARLRHAAALLLAEHGHHGATVTLDADLAEAKGG